LVRVVIDGNLLGDRMFLDDIPYIFSTVKVLYKLVHFAGILFTIDVVVVMDFRRIGGSICVGFDFYFAVRNRSDGLKVGRCLPLGQELLPRDAVKEQSDGTPKKCNTKPATGTYFVLVL